MIPRLLAALLLPQRQRSLAEIQRRIEDGSATMLEITQYLNVLDKLNKTQEHANRLARV
jgi:hypothetical protein